MERKNLWKYSPLFELTEPFSARNQNRLAESGSISKSGQILIYVFLNVKIWVAIFIQRTHNKDLKWSNKLGWACFSVFKTEGPDAGLSIRMSVSGSDEAKTD